MLASLLVFSKDELSDDVLVSVLVPLLVPYLVSMLVCALVSMLDAASDVGLALKSGTQSDVDLVNDSVYGLGGWLELVMALLLESALVMKTVSSVDAK